MRCSSCSMNNRENAKFCNTCGSAMPMSCPRCGAANGPDAKFCDECGLSFLGVGAGIALTDGKKVTPASHTLPMPSAPETEAVPDDERKTITAVFADLKDSTELMEGLDPEEARSIVDPALRIMVDAVRRYEGYVVQSTGDGIFALFGAPAAYEDHPQRALHAALQMQRELREYGQRRGAHGGVGLECRIGINTGEVVVRAVETGGKVEYTPIGHTANLASRLQTVAPAGSIAVSERTSKLVEGYFELRAMEPTPIKGISEPVIVYEVIGLGSLRTHFQLSARRGLTKFVGRERELSEINRALERAWSGRGQIVAAMAAAGTGKSRLLYEFKRSIPHDCLLLEAYSVSHGKASAYQPVLELMHGYFGITGVDERSTRCAKVSSKLAALHTDLTDTLPYLFALFGIQEPPDPLAQMDPQVRRRRTLNALKRIILRESLNQPTVVIFEDLHWIDAETQALLDVLADSIANSRMLLLVNYRPEYRHEWGNKSYYTQLRLEPLERGDAEQMVDTLLTSPAPATETAGANRERSAADIYGRERVRAQGDLTALKRMIIERTEGNPFFIEETAQALFDEGALQRNGSIKVTRSLSQLRLPPTIQGMLASRIDRLPRGHKELIQVLAVIGRESPLALIRQVISAANGELEARLAALEAGEFIYERPASTDVEYVFKHALTQEVAYNSLLIERRKLLHERVGAAIEEIHAGRLDDHLTKLARHYQRSGNTCKALEYLGRAGHQAAGRSSHPEAAGLFTSALELLTTLPETAERIQQELRLQLGLGPALQCIKGWTAPEVESVYARARELCRQLGDPPQLFPVLAGLFALSLTSARLYTAREQAEQLLSIAQNQPDADILPVAHYALGLGLFYLGEFASARAHLERACSLYDPAQHRSLAALYGGVDVGVNSLVHLAWTQWFLGYTGHALDRVEQAQLLAEELSHPFSLCHALYFSSALHTLCREGEAALKFADKSIRLATDNGFQHLLAWALCSRGGALMVQGQDQEAIAQLREGLAAMYALGSALPQTLVLGWQASSYSRLERVEEGLVAVAEALAASETTGERFFEAELYRLRGDLLLKRDAQEPESKVEREAEVCFRQGLEISCRQQAKSLELRARTSLAGLFANQSSQHHTCAMLSEIYGWFTQGFDMADLKEAKALLAKLRGHSANNLNVL